MSAAAYNRGSRVLRDRISRELEDRRRRPCNGRMRNGPEKRYARCSVCGAIDYELNEGDRCRVVVVRR